MKSSIRVLVTGVDSITNKPGLAILRSLSDVHDMNLRLFAADYAPASGGFYAGFAEKSFVTSPPTVVKSYVRRQDSFSWTSVNPVYVREIVKIVKSESIDVVIPSLSMEQLVYAKIRSSVERSGARIALPDLEKIEIASDKNLQYEFMDQIGITVPRWRLLDSERSVRRIIKVLGLPLVVKSRRHGACVATSEPEAILAYRMFRRFWRELPLGQDYVKGVAYCVSSVSCRGQETGIVAIRKISTDSEGASTAAVTIYNPQLLRLHHQVVEKLGWTGAIETEWRLDTGEKIFKLLEINGRFPAWIYLSVKAGVNLPWQLVRLALGEEVKVVSDYKYGIAFVRNAWDVVLGVDNLLSSVKRISPQYREPSLIPSWAK